MIKCLILAFLLMFSCNSAETGENNISALPLDNSIIDNITSEETHLTMFTIDFDKLNLWSIEAKKHL